MSTWDETAAREAGAVDGRAKVEEIYGFRDALGVAGESADPELWSAAARADDGAGKLGVPTDLQEAYYEAYESVADAHALEIAQRRGGERVMCKRSRG